MYIRTKDGVYEVKREEVLCGVKFYDIEDDDHLNRIREEWTVKEFDTIEELCDRYIGISNSKPMIIKYEFDEYYDEYGDTYTKEELLMEYDIIYGAIYTDKGLIYVAKMNDKGELELI